MPFLLLPLLGVGAGWYATNETVKNANENGVNWTLIVVVIIVGLYLYKRGIV